MPGILSTPTELLLQIITDIPLSSQVALLRTCKEMQYFMSSIIYRRVKLNGTNAKLFSITLISPTTINYARLIKSLEFRATLTPDIFTTYPLFLDALCNMRNLQQLALYVPNGHSSFVTTLIKSKGLARETQSLHHIIDQMTAGETACSAYTLPNLQSYTFRGEPTLGILAANRKLSSITILHPIPARSLGSLLDNVQCKYLTNMKLSLCGPSNTELILVFYFIAGACILLTDLEIDTGIFNALDVTKALASGACFSPTLRTISINATDPNHPAFGLRKLDAYLMQLEHLKTASIHLTELFKVRFGPVEWIHKTRGWHADYFHPATFDTLPTSENTDFSCFYLGTHRPI